MATFILSRKSRRPLFYVKMWKEGKVEALAEKPFEKSMTNRKNFYLDAEGQRKLLDSYNLTIFKR